MDFISFAEQHGLIIDSLVSDRWVRVPTIDHPRKKNGSYLFNGQSGVIQNWAVHERPIVWHSKEGQRYDPLYREKRVKAEKDRANRQAKAKEKAKYMLDNSKLSKHPYLASKGFEDEKGYVYNGLLLVPMRVSGELVGCQVIDPDGNKRFLSGQITKNAEAIFDGKGRHIICEGYATALSVRRVMRHLKKRYTIHVAFSAGNMIQVAQGYDPFVVADNDLAGIKSAKKIGKYWLSDVEGEDFNDAEKRLGTKALALCFDKYLQSLSK